MKKLLFYLILLVSISVNGQSINLRILGQNTYVDSLEGYGAVIILQENPNKCDPVLGFISIEEQHRHLREHMKALGSVSRLKPVADYVYTDYRRKLYRFEETNADRFYEILEVCKDKTITVKNTYFKLPDHRFEEEDEKALGALEKAKLKAEIIANHLDYKVSKILNVDDDTTFAAESFDVNDMDPERLELLVSLMDRLSSSSTNSTESAKPQRKGQYNLWVTFEMVPR